MTFTLEPRSAKATPTSLLVLRGCDRGGGIPRRETVRMFLCARVRSRKCTLGAFSQESGDFHLGLNASICYTSVFLLIW